MVCLIKTKYFHVKNYDKFIMPLQVSLKNLLEIWVNCRKILNQRRRRPEYLQRSLFQYSYNYFSFVIKTFNDQRVSSINNNPALFISNRSARSVCVIISINSKVKQGKQALYLKPYAVQGEGVSITLPHNVNANANAIANANAS